MSKVGQVVKFEVVRSLKKPSFWIAAILVPIAFAIYILICATLGYNTGTSLESGSAVDGLKLAYVDEANYLKDNTFTNEAQNEQTLAKYEKLDVALNDLKQGKLNVLYHIPEDFKDSGQVNIYTKNEKNSVLDDYKAPIAALLTASAKSNVDEIDYKIISEAINYNTTAFASDNHVIDQKELISKIIPPAACLALFYILMVVLGNRLAMAVTEEKENRISELLLVSIKPVSLIVGKIISLMLVGIIQLIILLIPVGALYILASNQGMIPQEFSFDLDPTRVILSALVLIASYLIFTAVSVLCGALVSTAKEASNFTGIIVFIMIIPLLLLNIFLDNSNPTLSTVLSYFPISAPMALMLRAIFDNITNIELIIGIIDLTIVSALIIRLATYIFCKNAVDFSVKKNFKNLLGKPRKSWKD